jgi:hypothetical protein
VESAPRNSEEAPASPVLISTLSEVFLQNYVLMNLQNHELSDRSAISTCSDGSLDPLLRTSRTFWVGYYITSEQVTVPRGGERAQRGRHRRPLQRRRHGRSHSRLSLASERATAQRDGDHHIP